MVILLLNHDPEEIIRKQLYKLKKYSLIESAENHKNTEKLAEYVAKIHAQNINQEHFKIYNAQWVIEQVYKIKNVKHQGNLIAALEIMAQIETHNAPPKKFKFLSWDIIRSEWQKDYEAGKAGNFTWDIAAIINTVSNAQFSEIFLTSYLKHGGQKPTLSVLYANLYYVQVLEAIKNKDFENIIEVTREIIDDTMFNTDIISYETLLKLNITGY
ncbi:MAG: hypothetical protein FWC41_02070 [Firmicutes bacterium]|nr:hypothetical protein [Bacillota bacterium]